VGQWQVVKQDMNGSNLPLHRSMRGSSSMDIVPESDIADEQKTFHDSRDAHPPATERSI